ncbi:hypothetical protein WA158_004555 [Blastocystis sp. Blastoise]
MVKKQKRNDQSESGDFKIFLFQDNKAVSVSTSLFKKYPGCILEECSNDENNRVEDSDSYYMDFVSDGVEEMCLFLSQPEDDYKEWTPETYSKVYKCLNQFFKQKPKKMTSLLLNKIRKIAVNVLLDNNIEIFDQKKYDESNGYTSSEEFAIKSFSQFEEKDFCDLDIWINGFITDELLSFLDLYKSIFCYIPIKVVTLKLPQNIYYPFDYSLIFNRIFPKVFPNLDYYCVQDYINGNFYRRISLEIYFEQEYVQKKNNSSMQYTIKKAIIGSGYSNYTSTYLNMPVLQEAKSIIIRSNVLYQYMKMLYNGLFPKVTELDFSEYLFNGIQEFGKLFDHTYSQIESLTYRISWNNSSNPFCQFINYIKKNTYPNLKHIIITGDLNAEMFCALYDAINNEYFPQLESLSMESVCVNETSIDYLYELNLRKILKPINTFIIKDCFKEEKIYMLHDLLLSDVCSHISNFSLDTCTLPIEWCEQLADVIYNGGLENVTELKINQTGISDEGMITLENTVVLANKFQKLSSIYFSNNIVSDSSLVYLFDNLTPECLPALESLQFENIPFQDSMFISACNAFDRKCLSKLTQLSLYRCKVSNDGILAFYPILERCHMSKNLTISCYSDDVTLRKSKEPYVLVDDEHHVNLYY